MSAEKITTIVQGRPVAHHELVPFRQRRCTNCDASGVVKLARGRRRLCSCMRRRFMRKHQDDVERGPDGNIWWKAGRAPPAPPATTLILGDLKITLED